MRHRCARLAGITVCAAALAAGSASAETQTFTTPGTIPVTLPTGVARVHVVAVGGRGGGDLGGFGAVVTGDVGVLLSGLPETSPMLLIRVGGNGGIGIAGVNSGGTAGAPGFPTFAGGGGGTSTLAPCMQLSSTGGGCAVYLNLLLAAGGGGTGAPTILSPGGAGGSAGAPGGAGSSTASLTAANGGGAGSATTIAAGGAGSLSSDPGCDDGSDGDGGYSTLRNGGAGGLSADLSGHGDGGGGGGGIAGGGGGGGGGGSFCSGDGSGTSGAGGGGGVSRVPDGGSIAIDATGQPYVQITYELEHPTIAIAVPVDGETYLQGHSIGASYTCTAPDAFRDDSVSSCTGPAAPGESIDTNEPGDHAFTVTATDAFGLTGSQTVHYNVVDLTAPRIHRVRILPRSIDVTQRGDYATVRFTLSEPSSVRAAVHLARGKQGHAARARTWTLTGHAGRNSFKLRARIGRRTLRAGDYRLTLVATDRSGNRSRAVSARFSVTD